jgi:hypothetical protein
VEGKKSEGILPVRSLLLKSKNRNIEALPMLSGKEEVRKLNSHCTEARVDENMCAGIVPVNRLKAVVKRDREN